VAKVPAPPPAQRFKAVKDQSILNGQARLRHGRASEPTKRRSGARPIIQAVRKTHQLITLFRGHLNAARV
jgi:hypothetical protein